MLINNLESLYMQECKIPLRQASSKLIYKPSYFFMHSITNSKLAPLSLIAFWMKHVPTKVVVKHTTLSVSLLPFFFFKTKSNPKRCVSLFHSIPIPTPTLTPSFTGDTMAIAAGNQKPTSDANIFRLCPFWSSGNTQNQSEANVQKSSKTVSSVARSLLLPPRRRLRLDPSNHLYFPYEPGKQVRSAVRLKNTSKSRVAFKFQTTAPKSCYMRPPGGILAPGESMVATVFKFVEQPENNEKLSDQKNKVKFKIMSLKVKEGVDYVPELFDEQKDLVTVERVLGVVFLDPERPSPALEKLKRQLAEADAELETRKKPAAETGPRVAAEGLVIDEWKERREKYLAKQQVQAVDTV